MAKDIRIELLQDRQNVRIGEQMLSNSEFSNSTGWTTPALSSTDSFTFTSGKMEKNTTGSGAARATIPCVFVEGYEYQIKVAVKEYNRNGQLLLANHGVSNSNVSVLSSTIVPSLAPGTGTDYGYYTINWTQGSSNLTKLSLYANDGVKLKLSWIRVYRTATDKSSVFGILDASTTEDFPLALTFSVNDPANIDARKGAYSKTFQVPATKNNNIVLKNFGIPNSTHQDAQLYDKISCRILVGNLFSLRGLLQLQDVQRLNDKPISYSCVFLGDNLSWSTEMDGKYLSELQLKNSTNLKLSAKEITKSWGTTDATIRASGAVNDSPVVYPLASYGQVNETGFDFGNGFQLFREQWEIDYMNNVSYNISQTGFLGTNQWNAVPVMDWRPLVWIYNMMHKIFNDAGYKLSSAFVESDQFKRLLYASPNFLYNNSAIRQQANTYSGNFLDSSTCSATQANLKIFDETSNVGASVANQGGILLVNGTNQTPYEPIRFGGSCGSGDGSARFQPAPNVITTTQGNQQDLKITSAAVGNFWTVPTAGRYTITTQNIMYYFNWQQSDWSGSGSFSSGNTGLTMYANIVVEKLVVANSSWYPISAVDNQSATALGGFKQSNQTQSYGGTLPPSSFTAYFNEGDKIRLTLGMAPIFEIQSPNQNFTGATIVNIQAELFGTAYNDWAASNGSVTIELDSPDTPVFGGEYNLQDIFPNDQKQIEFVKGVAHSFNLQFYTEESSKTVFTEPYPDFYLPPRDAIDWTHKLARNLSDVQSFIQNNWTRRLIFKYQTDDKDSQVKRMSEVYFDNIGDMYPKQVDLSRTYPAGETIFENPFFAGTYESQSFGAGETELLGRNFYTAALWANDYWYRSPKGYQFKPRMLYYNRMTMPIAHDPLWQGFRVENGSQTVNAFNFSRKKVQVADVTLLPQTAFAGNTNVYVTNAPYCSATFVNRFDFSNQFGLSYGNYWAKDYDPATNIYTYVGNQVGRGLYSRYYESMIEGLKARPKLRVCYIDLKITDITRLDFRKMVYIDGCYYKIIRVVDFKPHLNEPTKVELHQFNPGEGSVLPTSGVWINNTLGGGSTTGGGGGGPILDDNGAYA